MTTIFMVCYIFRPGEWLFQYSQHGGLRYWLRCSRHFGCYASGLEPELVVAAYEGTDGDGLVQNRRSSPVKPMQHP